MLSDVVHRILDCELDRLKGIAADKLAFNSGYDDVDLRSYFGSVAYGMFSQRYSADSVDAGLSVARQAYSDPESMPEGMADDIRELLGDIDHAVLMPPNDIPFNPNITAQQEYEQLKVNQFAQAVLKARGVAYTTASKDLDVPESLRQKAHEDLDDYHPLSKSQGSAALSAQVELFTSGANVAQAQNMFQSIAQAAGLSIPAPVTLGEAVEFYKQSILADPIKHPSGLDPAKRRAIDEFVRAVGAGTQTTSLKLDTVERYVNLLYCLPKNMEFDELRGDMWTYITEPHDGLTIKDGTIKARLVNLRCLFRDMRMRNFIGQDLLEVINTPLRSRINLIEKKSSLEQKERPYEIEELKILFAPDSYLAWSCLHSADYWLPLLALFTGARMGELITLRAKDIKKTPEQPCFVRRRDKSRDNIFYIDLTDTTKKIKTEISHRVIPIHDALLKLGFLDYVSDFMPDSYLFPFYLGEDNDDRRACPKNRRPIQSCIGK